MSEFKFEPFDGDLEALIQRIKESMRVVGERIQRKVALLRSLQVTPEMIEARSKLKYKRAVAREREIGLTFVKAEADRVRRELGLG